MEVLCYQCGGENWLENEIRCRACNAILRRCIDCSCYDRRTETCQDQKIEIDAYEAEHPSLLSGSTNCHQFGPAPGAALKVKQA